MAMKLAQNEDRVTSQVPFSIFGVFEHPHGVSADHTTSASGAFTVHAKRIRVPMIRKTKFRASPKISLLHILLSICVDTICRVMFHCFMFMFLLSKRTHLIPALPRCLAVRLASGQQAGLGVGVNLIKFLSVYYCDSFVGAKGMEGSCVFIYHCSCTDIAGDEDYCNGLRFYVQSQTSGNSSGVNVK